MKHMEYIEDIAIADDCTESIVTRAATGRRIPYVNPDQEAVYQDVINWMSCSEESSFFSHPLFTRFQEAIRRLPTLTGQITVYRGRSICAEETASLKSTDFGPPTSQQAEDRRYNRVGHPALYLASITEGVKREIEILKPGYEIYCQKYLIDTGALKIVDLSSHISDEFVSYAFDFTERLDRGGSENSRRLADAVLNLGYGGMQVPGIRGSIGHHYSNLIIFKPGDDWKNWVVSGEDPYPLAKP